MNRDNTAGVLAAHQQKRNWPINLSKLRQVVSWPLIIVFAIGSIILWQSALGNLIHVGGFAGIISWQVLGFFLPVYQVQKVRWRAVERDSIGRFVAPVAMRRRLWAMIMIIWANVVANAAAIGLVVWNMGIGRLQLSLWDKVAFGFAIAMVIALVAIKRRQLTKSQPAMFFLAASTRMVPQICLAFSLSLGHIPWPALLGVAAIAGQRLVISSIELAEGKTVLNNHKHSIIAASWVWRADLGNTVAIAVPIVAKAFL